MRFASGPGRTFASHPRIAFHRSPSRREMAGRSSPELETYCTHGSSCARSRGLFHFWGDTTSPNRLSPSWDHGTPCAVHGSLTFSTTSSSILRHCRFDRPNAIRKLISPASPTVRMPYQNTELTLVSGAEWSGVTNRTAAANSPECLVLKGN